MLQCAPRDSEAPSLITLSSIEQAREPNVHSGSPEQFLIWEIGLGRNQEISSATPTDIGVFPIPIKLWIYFAVVAGYSAKAQQHGYEA
jgi:hypothetical protein